MHTHIHHSHTRTRPSTQMEQQLAMQQMAMQHAAMQQSASLAQRLKKAAIAVRQQVSRSPVYLCTHVSVTKFSCMYICSGWVQALHEITHRILDIYSQCATDVHISMLYVCTPIYLRCKWHGCWLVRTCSSERRAESKRKKINQSQF